jgi:hypothetical protein
VHLDLVAKHNIPQEPKSHPVPLEVADGRPISTSTECITHSPSFQSSLGRRSRISLSSCNNIEASTENNSSSNSGIQLCSLKSLNKEDVVIAIISLDHRSVDAPRLPEEFKDFGDIFSKTSADVLPPSTKYSHSNPLEKDTKPPFGPIYALSEIELEAAPIQEPSIMEFQTEILTRIQERQPQDPSLYCKIPLLENVDRPTTRSIRTAISLSWSPRPRSYH